MVRKLDNFYELTNYSSKETVVYRLNNQRDGGAPEKDFLDYLQINNLLWLDKVRLFFAGKNLNKRTKIILGRKDKINRLFNDCIDDGFIERVDRKTIVADTGRPIVVNYEPVGIKPSGKDGKDLTHWMGFLEAASLKYPLTIKSSLRLLAILGGAGVLTLFFRWAFDSMFHINL
jgi:hypothetical protein